MPTKRARAAWDAITSGRMTTKYRDLIQLRHHPEFHDLIILNYTTECQYKRKWDNVTINCRGLILNRTTGEAVALPFPKFFNLSERPETQLDVLPHTGFTAFEKIDGFLGVFYRTPDGKPALASRGAFDSDMAIRGTKLLHQCSELDEIPAHYTLVFEIVYPNNLLVTRYDFEGLVLLTIFDRFTGTELRWKTTRQWAERLGVRTPPVYPFTSIQEAAKSIRTLPADTEGWVLRYENGFRVKLKGRAYLEKFRVLQGITPERVKDILVSGQYDWWISEVVPEEFHEEAVRMADPIVSRLEARRKRCFELFERAPKSSRKDFAFWVLNNVPEPPMQYVLFALYGKTEPEWWKLLEISDE